MSPQLLWERRPWLSPLLTTCLKLHNSKMFWFNLLNLQLSRHDTIMDQTNENIWSTITGYLKWLVCTKTFIWPKLQTVPCQTSLQHSPKPLSLWLITSSQEHTIKQRSAQPHGPMWLRRTLFLCIIFITEHQNHHKSFLLHCVLINRPMLSRLQMRILPCMVTVSGGLDLGLEKFSCP